MPQLNPLIQQIRELDPVEREELVFALSEGMLPFHPLMVRWLECHHAQECSSIVTSPNVCGGAARLIRTRIPVWTIERLRQLGASEVDILRSYPTLRAVDFVQAWTYAARNPTEIEKAIRENEEE